MGKLLVFIILERLSCEHRQVLIFFGMLLLADFLFLNENAFVRYAAAVLRCRPAAA